MHTLRRTWLFTASPLLVCIAAIVCTAALAQIGKEQMRRQRALQMQMVDPYCEWLHEEVPYIISDQERAAFKRLSTDKEREAFIKNFWDRRNPHPSSSENECKQQYYQRIIYANEQFGSGIPGWKTDRGRIFITYGSPDIPVSSCDEDPDSHCEQWRYGYIRGVGNNIILRFVDPDNNGEYHLEGDILLKDALMQAGSLAPAPHEEPPGGPNEQDFTRLDLYTKVIQLPAQRSVELQSARKAEVPDNLLPFETRTDFIRATSATVLVPFTIKIANRDLQFRNKDGVMHDAVDIYGEVANLRHQVVTTFEKRLIMASPPQYFQQYLDRATVYQQALFLGPGRYELKVAMKDELSGHIGAKRLEVSVPAFPDGKLAYSSLILADRIMPLPPNVWKREPFMWEWGPFSIGAMNVRPIVDATFSRDQAFGFYIQIYHLGINERTHRSSLEVRYEITKDGKKVLDEAEDRRNLQKASQQFTVAKLMSLKDFSAGAYTLQINVTDNLTQQAVHPSAIFQVR